MALKDFPTLARNEEGIALVVGILKQRLGERLVTGRAVREQHGHTTTYLPGQAPDAVAFPRDVAEVQEIVRACADYRVPVIGYGARAPRWRGTSTRPAGASPSPRARWTPSSR